MIQELTVESEVLGVPHHSLVLWPDSPPRPTAPRTGGPITRTPVPVLYLFRGRSEEWFLVPPERRGRNLESVMNHLAELGYLEPFPIVCPDTLFGPEEQAVYGLALDLAEVPEGVPGLGTGCFRRFFLEEYLPRVEEQLFPDAPPIARAVGGFSLGSVAAFTMAFSRPELFTAVTSYDGAFLFWNHDHPEGVGPLENDLCFDIFPEWFGDPPILGHFLAQDPLHQLETAAGRNLEALRRLHFFQHASAETDPCANAWREERMRHAVAAAGGRQEVTEGLLAPGSRHDWYWVDEHLYRILPRVGHRLWERVRGG